MWVVIRCPTQKVQYELRVQVMTVVAQLSDEVNVQKILRHFLGDKDLARAIANPSAAIQAVELLCLR